MFYFYVSYLFYNTIQSKYSMVVWTLQGHFLFLTRVPNKNKIPSDN